MCTVVHVSLILAHKEPVVLLTHRWRVSKSSPLLPSVYIQLGDLGNTVGYPAGLSTAQLLMEFGAFSG